MSIILKHTLFPADRQTDGGVHNIVFKKNVRINILKPFLLTAVYEADGFCLFQHNYYEYGMDINVTDVWTHNVTGRGVTVAVVDDGKIPLCLLSDLITARVC